MYEQYENKLHKLRMWLHRLRFVILGAVLLLAIVFAYIYTVGFIYHETSVNSVYEYGEPINPVISATVSGREYRYRSLDDSDAKWTEEAPREIGKYEVQGYTISKFGIRKNAGTDRFEITQRKLQVTAKKISVRGRVQQYDVSREWIQFEGLVYGDSVKDFGIERQNISDREARYSATDVQIVHADGTEADSCYRLSFGKGSILDSRIPITVKTGSKYVTYSGNPHEKVSCEEFEIVSGKLRDGDTLTIRDFPVLSHITNEGKEVENYVPERDMVITDRKGNDVTADYTITVQSGWLAFYRSAIMIQSGSAEKDYDGTPLTEHTFKVSGNLMPQDSVKMEFYGTITEPGSTDNDYSFSIISAEYGDVTDCYYVLIKYGELVVHGTDERIPGSDSKSFSMDNEGLGGSLGGEADNRLLFRFLGTQNRDYYFREHTYGVYTGRGWECSFAEQQNLLNSYTETGRVLKNNQATKDLVRISDKKLTTMIYPYFMEELKENIDNPSAYSCECYLPVRDTYPTADDEKANIVRADAYMYYMDVPSNVKSVLLKLGMDEGIAIEDPDKVEKIAYYIQNAAVYNLHFPEFPANEDMVVYFLTKGKQGICQHFAAAATLMYRVYGIPARYTVGYMKKGVANQWTTVDGMCGHAWVEIYLDGVGWIPMEVTGASAEGDSGEKQDPVIQPNEWADERADLVLRFSTMEREYDGNVVRFSPKLKIWEGLLKKGDTLYYEADEIVSGPEIGNYEGKYRVAIRDRNGMDVTEEYNMYIISPAVSISPRQIEITTFGNSGEQMPGGISDNHWYISKGSLANGDRIEISLTESQDSPGKRRNKPSDFRIFDKYDEDVTYRYQVDFVDGVLSVQ